MLPKIKRKIVGFLLNEEGKITRQSLLTLGSITSAYTFSAILAAKDAQAEHVNGISVTGDPSNIEVTHGHHQSHSSHGSHSSHSSGTTSSGGTTGDS